MGLAQSNYCLLESRSAVVRKEFMHYLARLSPNTLRQFPCRTVDLTNRNILTDIISKVHKRNPSPTIVIETEDAYELQCTLDTLLYTPNGFVTAQNLQIGDVIWTNGTPDERYKDKDFLLQCKSKGMKYADIAEACNISVRTIRAYFKRYNINEGKTGSLSGEDNPNFKGDQISKKGGYMRMQQLAIQWYHEGLLPHAMTDKGLFHGICPTCDNEADLDIHHENHDTTDNRFENLSFICEKCHRAEHSGPSVRHVRKSIISNIYHSSIEPTYDVSIPSGCYVASGFIIKSVEQ